MKILVLAALEEEIRPFINSFENFQDHVLPNGDIYFHSKLANNDEVFASFAPKYSKVQCACHTTRLMNHINPDVAIMIGICAGDKTKLKLGDVVICEKTFDGETGKTTDREFFPDMQVHEIQTPLMTLVKKNLNLYKTALENFDTKNKPSIMLGTFCCLSSVTENKYFFADKKYSDRKTIALDMESYAFMDAVKSVSQSCHAIVAKGVCDFANSKKDDSFHMVAANSSAFWASFFIKNDCKNLSVVNNTFNKNINYAIIPSKPAQNRFDRELWRRIIGWSESYEDFFQKNADDDSGLTFYPIGENKYLLEISLGFYAYQAGYLFAFIDESGSSPHHKLIQFKTPHFDSENILPSSLTYDEEIIGLVEFDAESSQFYIYHKFRGVGDGYFATYQLAENGKTELTDLVLRELPDTDFDEANSLDDFEWLTRNIDVSQFI